MKNKILQGNAIDLAKTLPDNHIDMIITSPPYYGLRDYDTEPVVFGGDSECEHDFETTERRLHGGSKKDDFGCSRGIIADWVTTDNVCNKCGAWAGQLGLETTPQEYITNLCDLFSELKRPLKDTGTCWVNIGDTYNSTTRNTKADKKYCERVGYDTSFNARKEHPDADRKPIKSISTKSLIGIPFRFAIEMIDRGWLLRNTIIWHKPSCMPSPVKDRFTVDFEYLYFFSQKKKYHFKTQYEPARSSDYDKARMKKGNWDYQAKWHEAGSNQFKLKKGIDNPDMRIKRTVWPVVPARMKDAHFAVFPEKLIESPIDAGCPEGGIVLDPFMGAGTTAVVAENQNKNWLGFELNPEYIKIAEDRLDTPDKAFFR